MSQPNITLQLDRIFHLIKLLSTESLSGPQIVARLHFCGGVPNDPPLGI